MATLTDIRSTNWQLSLLGAGQVAEGLEDIRQCIDVILRTPKGSDALRPQFGSDVYEYIDRPVNITIPNVKRAILEAIGIWEKRVKNVRVTHILNGEQIQFFISYSLADEDVTDQVQLYLRKQDVVVTPALPQQLILQGLFPETYQQLKISLLLNGTEQQPQAPVNGFSTPQQLFAWAVANWSFIGGWYLLPDKIILFVNNGFATTGSITITSKAVRKLIFAIPAIEIGQQYRLAVTAPGNPGTELASNTANNLGSLLQWLQDNYSQYGDWDIENIITGIGDFEETDFAETDFKTTGNYYQFVLYTTDDTAAGLSITTV